MIYADDGKGHAIDLDHLSNQAPGVDIVSQQITTVRRGDAEIEKPMRVLDSCSFQMVNFALVLDRFKEIFRAAHWADLL